MAVGTLSNYANLSNFVNKAGLEVAKPMLFLTKFGKKITIPDKASRNIKFKRVERLAPLTGAVAGSVKALTEGAVPGDVNPTETNYTLTLSQYGNVSRLSDMVGWTSEVDVDGEVVKRNAENMVQTIERVYYDGIVGGTSVQYASDSIGGTGAGRANVAGKINAVLLDKAIRTLQSNDAKVMTKQLTPSNAVGTQGVRSGFIAIITPQIKYDLEQIPGFIDVSKYPGGGAQPGEVGAYKELRFFMSTLDKQYLGGSGATTTGLAQTGSLNDVHVCLIIADNAFAAVDLASASEQFYVSGADSGNPLNQFVSIGWKAACGSIILNDAFITRIEVGVSA